MFKREYTLLYIYLLVGLVLFFGSYSDRVERARFLGRTIYLPLTYTRDLVINMRKLEAERDALRFRIGEVFLQTIELEKRLNKYDHSHIEFAVAETNYILADVIGFSGDFFGRTIILSKGLQDGVRVDNPVFSSKGIVGKVIASYQNLSIVLPINHSNFKLAVLNKNSGAQGILVADVYANIAMEYMSFGSRIAVGDTIVTSNLSQIFPAYYPIGTVQRLQESADALYFRAIIQPFNDISNIQYVYVLLRDKKEITDVDIETDY